MIQFQFSMEIYALICEYYRRSNYSSILRKRSDCVMSSAKVKTNPDFRAEFVGEFGKGSCVLFYFFQLFINNFFGSFSGRQETKQNGKARGDIVRGKREKKGIETVVSSFVIHRRLNHVVSHHITSHHTPPEEKIEGAAWEGEKRTLIFQSACPTLRPSAPS